MPIVSTAGPEVWIEPNLGGFIICHRSRGRGRDCGSVSRGTHVYPTLRQARVAAGLDGGVCGMTHKTEIQAREVLLSALLDPAARPASQGELTIDRPLAWPVLEALLRLLTDRSVEPWASPNSGGVDFTGTLPCGLRLRLVQEAPPVGAGETR